MAEKYKQLVNPGKVTLWNKETGEAISRYPADANEILANSDIYTDEKPEGAKEVEAAAAVPVDLSKKTKAELIEFAKVNGITVSTQWTKEEITAAIEEALGGDE